MFKENNQGTRSMHILMTEENSGGKGVSFHPPPTSEAGEDLVSDFALFLSSIFPIRKKSQNRSEFQNIYRNHGQIYRGKHKKKPATTDGGVWLQLLPGPARMVSVAKTR